MSEPVDLLGIYLHLAWASERRNQPQVTDRLLLLAAVTAAELGLEATAQGCRERILAHNPQHLVKHWLPGTAATDAPDLEALLRQLQRRYPREKLEQMLHDLGIERGRERASYFSDEEYAQALLARVRFS